jgi:hypothetical protein
MSAIIRFHLHIDPDELSEDEFAKAWCQVEYVLKKINGK